MADFNEDDHPRNPKGAANSMGGKFAVKDVAGNDGDLDAPVDAPLAVATLGLREQARRDRMAVKSADETRALLAETTRVEYGPNGLTLLDANGDIVFREDESAPGLDAKTLRHNRLVQKSMRDLYASTLEGTPAGQRRDTVRAAWRYASPYTRRKAIDGSPLRRYINADSLAASLKRRGDRRQAVDVMAAIHYEDANTSAAIIRAGFPDDQATAMAFINKTKIKRDKDGNAVIGEYTPSRGKHKGERVTGPLPESKGAAGRSYLRMMYCSPTAGNPDGPATRRMARALDQFKDDPQVQARVFYEMCYGRGGAKDDMTETMKNIVRRRSRYADGMRAIDAYADHPGGQGNAARMVAYQKCLTHEAAVAFCAMTPGDDRRANTPFTRRRRVDGQMRDVTPARLTEMRAFIHSAYSVSKSEVDEWKAAHAEADA